MTETIEYEQFDQTSAQAGALSASEADLSRLSDIPMELSVEIGRTHMTVGETLDLRVGSVVTLERLAGQTADLLVNGTAIARGEVVVVDEQYGLRITEIIDSQQDPETGQPASASRDDASASQGHSASPQGGASSPQGDPPASQGAGPESEAVQATAVAEEG
ncbi:MAG TPA: flagellar motor switch protein FliN [Solirubrobacteraceae bacterium]|nr:flagellar motor switch protein FliN [Solirubrobacteraceae bacterium]